MKRALLATTLIALGLAIVPLTVGVPPGSPPRPAAYAIGAAFFSLPMAVLASSSTTRFHSEFWAQSSAYYSYIPMPDPAGRLGLGVARPALPAAIDVEATMRILHRVDARAARSDR